MNRYWLDIGAGLDAEHWSALPAPKGVIRVALDPLFTRGMVESRRLAPLPAGIHRVGGEVRPAGSVEVGKPRSTLPFADAAFHRVHCGFVLHLYLETLELMAEECHRVLRPGGDLTLLIPLIGHPSGIGSLERTVSTFARHFGEAVRTPFEGPFTTFWADLYRGRTVQVTCVRS